MNSQQKHFCDEYLIDLNGAKAAIRAGYSEHTARQYASQLLDNEEVQAYISERQKKVSDKLSITLERVLLNFQDVYVRCMQGEEVRDFEGNPTGEWKFDASNANRANENMGKHLGFFKEDNDQNKPITNINFQPLPVTSGLPLASTEKDVQGK